MKMNMRLKRFLCLIIALAMVCTGIVITPNTVANAFTTGVTNPSSEAVAEYGLQEDVQDGVILHCWDWSFNNIKEQMPQIAAAGYSAVQTSPIQEAKEATKGKTNGDWWVLYQPKSFYIDNTGNSALGTKDEFIAMCDEAHKYGIKVIVDVVANHLGNQTSGNISNAVASDIKDDPTCWHTTGMISISDYSNRNQVTQYSLGGLPDLNTESPKIQGYVLDYLKECIDAGADGFRFDAAKHIGVSEENESYTFWENTLEKVKVYAKESRGIDIYAYGEILHGTEGPAISAYTKYMSVTENASSDNIRHNIAAGNAAGAASSYYSKGASADKLVMWAESHDTYSNDSRESTNISDSDIKKTWAMVASRANASALYFVRTNGWRAGNMGDICTWDWKSKEVIAVNQFHNFFHGESEYLASSGSIAYNERGTSGVVLVNCGGMGTTVSVKANRMEDGTYTDQITGNTFTVADGMISGTIGSTGIAVVYNEEVKPTPTISMEGGKFTSDVLTITIGLKNATSGTYKINNMSASTYTTTKTITFGDMEIGDKVTITLTATDGETTTTKVYIFEKVAKSNKIAYLDLPTGWSTNVYCYAYDKETNNKNAKWPGVLMQYDSATGYYECEIPESLGDARVIFYSSDTNRYPEDGKEGLKCSGEFVYHDGIWEALNKETYEAPYEYGIYFKDEDDWGSVNMYCWDESENKLKEWPGSEMTYLGDGIYGIELSKEQSNMKYVIFNTTGKQTEDLKFFMNSVYNTDGILMDAEYGAEEGGESGEGGELGEDDKPVRLPSVVNNFVVSERSANTITLKWDKSEDETGYIIKQNKNGEWIEITRIADIETLSYKVTGLSSAQNYEFSICAYRIEKDYEVGGSSSSITTMTLPAFTYGFAISASTVNSITLKWTKNDSAAGYVIEQYKDGKWTVIKTITSNATVSYKVTGLNPTTSYQFRIKGYAVEGSAKVYGNPAQATFKTASPIDLSKATLSISQPSFGYTGEYIKPVVTVKIIVDGQTKTLVNWTDYKVEYKNFMNPGTATITVVGRGEYTGQKSMTFIIRPVDLSKCSITLNQPSFGYTGEYIKPVVNVKATINGKEVLLTNWKDYKVTYKNFKNPGVATITVESRGITSGTYTLAFQIRPPQVKNVKYVGKSATYVEFKWDSCFGATGYEVYRATSKDGTYFAIGTSTTTSYKNIGLKSGTTYYYKVRAYKTVGNTKVYSNYSAVYTIATK